MLNQRKKAGRSYRAFCQVTDFFLPVRLMRVLKKNINFEYEKCIFSGGHVDLLFIYLFIYLYILYLFYISIICILWPRGLSCRSAATRLLRLWVRIPPAALMFV